MRDDALIVEVALHELVAKASNPHVPYGPDEVADDAVACVDAGATFLHFHARDAVTGEQRWHDDAVYAQTVAAIRERGVAADVPWYPTYPGVRPGVAIHDSMPHLAALAAAPIGLELAAIDLGSGNLSAYDPVHKAFLNPDGVKQQPHSLFGEFAGFCRAHGLRPYLGVYEPGHLRHIAAYLDLGWIEPPLAIKCFFSEHHPYGLPPVPRSVEMTAELIDTVLAGVERTWFVQCYGRGIFDLAAPPSPSAATCASGSATTTRGTGPTRRRTSPPTPRWSNEPRSSRCARGVRWQPWRRPATISVSRKRSDGWACSARATTPSASSRCARTSCRSATTTGSRTSTVTRRST